MVVAKSKSNQSKHRRPFFISAAGSVNFEGTFTRQSPVWVFLSHRVAPSFDWLREKLTVTEASGSFFRFVAHARAPETSTSKLPPLLRGWERPSLYRRSHSRSTHPARVTDSLDSLRNERFHRRHFCHRYVTRVARPLRARVASSPRRALGALCLPDRICSLSSGFYSFSVGLPALALRDTSAIPGRRRGGGGLVFAP